jgi:hypothetical protein
VSFCHGALLHRGFFIAHYQIPKSGDFGMTPKSGDFGLHEKTL